MSPLCFSFGYCANYQASQENAVVDFKDWQIPLGRRFRYHSLYTYNACCINPAICVCVCVRACTWEHFDTVRLNIIKVEFILSLKLWLVLRLYGVANLQSYIRNHIRLAEQFEQLITSDSRFEVLSGNFILRFAVGAPLTEDRHIKIAWQVLQEQATTLLKDY
ncbi:hypothetical protein GW17_00052192 [Ensete ventricosum]|nr:hypothetical protein GW17_00052192 [Ensete ventricosum]